MKNTLKSTKKIPKTSMGSKRAIEVSICHWIDLLGYGSMLKEVDFNPLTQHAQATIDRLKIFQQIIRTNSKAKIYNSLTMNDGAVFYRDLSPRSKSVTFDFLNRAFKVHNAVNMHEQALSLPGCRSIVAVGFRVRDKNYVKEDLKNGIGQYLIDQVNNKAMSTEEAILKALAIKPCYDIVPDLQANFAFTKAYLADDRGSKGGFGGNNFYVDSSIFDTNIPESIKISEEQPFLDINGLNQPFYKILEFPNIPLKYVNNDLLDAFEIAEKITDDEQINKKLKQFAWKPNI